MDIARTSCWGTPWLIGAALAITAVASCARKPRGDPPPDQSFYYPVDVVVSPNHHYAYVLSSNSDLRFNAGWISVIDVDDLIDRIEDGDKDPMQAIVQQLRIPSLAAQMSVDPAGEFAAVAVRGEQPLTFIEIGDGGKEISCGEGSQKGLKAELKKTDCDAAHFTTVTTDAVRSGLDRDLPVEEISVADPFAINLFRAPADTGTLYAGVGYLSGGYLSLFAHSPDGELRLQPTRSIVVGASGISSLAVHPDATGVYLSATSMYFGQGSRRSAIYDVDITRSLDEPREDRTRIHAVSGRVGGFEMSGLVFAAGGRRAYAGNRDPDSVVIFNTEIVLTPEADPGGLTYQDKPWPAFGVLGAIPLPGRPAALALIERPGADILAVASFTSDSLYLMSPQGNGLRIDQRLDEVGAGPFALAAVHRRGRDLLLVANFFDHALAIVDVSSSDPQRYYLWTEVKSDEIEPSEDRAR